MLLEHGKLGVRAIDAGSWDAELETSEWRVRDGGTTKLSEVEADVLSAEALFGGSGDVPATGAEGFVMSRCKREPSLVQGR